MVCIMLFVLFPGEVFMFKSLPRWLILVIELVILVLVVAVVFYSVKAMDRAVMKTATNAQSTITSAQAHTTTASDQPVSTSAMNNKHVFLIVMENHNWSDIKNNASAPYINSTLLPMASYAEQYYNPPGNHPSEPNYLWLEAGTNFNIFNDDEPDENHQSTTRHLVTLLDQAGI